MKEQTNKQSITNNNKKEKSIEQTEITIYM